MTERLLIAKRFIDHHNELKQEEREVRFYYMGQDKVKKLSKINEQLIYLRFAAKLADVLELYDEGTKEQSM